MESMVSTILQVLLKNTPIESLEQHIPVLVERYEYEKNTGGAGQYRGGHAITLAFRILESDSMVTAEEWKDSVSSLGD